MAKAKPKPPDTPKKPAGRPSELTPEIEAKIIKGISLGMHRDEVAGFAGRHRSTIYYWMKKAQDDADAGTASPEQLAFLDGIKAAEASGVLARLERINSGDPGWQGSAWIQERRYSKQWAAVQKIAGDPDGAPIKIAFVDLHSAAAKDD